MDSSLNKKQSEEQRQADLRRQIALLQAQLTDGPDTTNSPCPTTPKKRKSEGQTVLANATPSPSTCLRLILQQTRNNAAEKKKVAHDKYSRFASSSGRTSGLPTPKAAMTSSHSNQTPPNKSIIPIASKPAPSAVLSKLASLSSSSKSAAREVVHRSAGFAEKAAVQPAQDAPDPAEPKRNSDLTVLEDLEPGPYEHTAPFDDPHFQRLEPHSGIRLSCVSHYISHDHVI